MNGLSTFAIGVAGGWAAYHLSYDKAMEVFAQLSTQGLPKLIVKDEQTGETVRQG